VEPFAGGAGERDDESDASMLELTGLRWRIRLKSREKREPAPSAAPGNSRSGRPWMRGFGGEAACLGGWRWALESAAVGLILFALVVFAAVGAGWLFAATVVSAWILMLVFMRPEDVWEAGYLFMLVALGIAVAVGLGQEGLGAIFPR
jgi:hypothetical protein